MNEHKYKVLIVDDHPDDPNCNLVEIYRKAIAGDESYHPDPDIIRNPNDVTYDVIKNAHIMLLDWTFENSKLNGGNVLTNIMSWREKGEDIRAKIIILSDLSVSATKNSYKSR